MSDPAPQNPDFAAHITRLRQVCLHPDRAGVKNLYFKSIELAPDAAGLESVFRLLRLSFPPWLHVPVLLRLEARLQALGEVSAPASILALNLRLAMRDIPGFLARYGQTAPEGELAPGSHWGMRFARLAALLNAGPYPNFAAPKVFGIGLSKTGTTSLNAALMQLGYLAMHYLNDFSGEMLGEQDAYLFDAMTDTPVCVMFELLLHRFPNAKFIYTTRARADWLDAFTRHCQRLYNTTDFTEILDIPRSRQHHPYITDFEKVDCALYFRHAGAAAAYDAYHERVMRAFSGATAARLLTLELGAGDEWGGICSFLGKPVPDIPYPWANKS